MTPTKDDSAALPKRAFGARHAAIAVAALALALYAATLAPTTALIDSGELIVAARTLGVAHPPGFPLYTLLAHWATLVPFGSIAVRVNALSALSAAVAAGLVALAVGEAIAGLGLAAARKAAPGKRSKAERKAAKVAADVPTKDAFGADLPPALPSLAALGAGLTFAASRTLWSYATVAEVYALNTALLAAVWLGLLGWRRRRLEAVLDRSAADSGRTAEIWLLGAAIAFGLALGVHHASAVLSAPAFALLVWRTPGFRITPRESLRAAAGAAIAAIGTYLYLPIAAAREPLLNWGDPSTLARFWRHVSGRQYQSFLDPEPGALGRQFAELAGYVGRDFGPAWLPLGLAVAALGLAILWRSDRTVLLAIVAVAVADIGLGLVYDIAEDQDAYLLPLLLALSLALGVGLARLGSRISGRVADRLAGSTPAGPGRPGGRPALAAIAPLGALVIALPAAALGANLPFCDRHGDRLAQEYVDDALRVVGPKGVILTLDWQLYSPLRYFRDVEGQRRDAFAINLNLLRRSWYLPYLRRAAPELLAAAHAEAAAYEADLIAWEDDPAAFERSPARLGRISREFRDLITALAARQLERGPLYATHEVVTGPPLGNTEVTNALAGLATPVPRGILFELSRTAAPAIGPLELSGLRSLFGRVRRLAPDDVVIRKVTPVYVEAFLFRATYLAGTGHPAAALAAIDEGLAAIPAGESARDVLERAREQLTGSDS